MRGIFYGYGKTNRSFYRTNRLFRLQYAFKIVKNKEDTTIADKGSAVDNNVKK